MTFIDIFNDERPHEALGMKCPAELHQPSTRRYQGLPDIDYPFHDKIVVVTNCGRICLVRKKINFSTVFAGQAVGIRKILSLREFRRIYVRFSAARDGAITTADAIGTLEWRQSLPTPVAG